MWSRELLDSIAKLPLPTITADSLADRVQVLEKRAGIATPVSGSLLDLLNALEKRTAATGQTGSLANIIAAIYTLAQGIPNTAQAGIWTSALATLIATNLNKPISQVADAAIWSQTVRDLILSRLDANVSSVPSGAASAVWAATTRTLTQLSMAAQIKSLTHYDNITTTQATVPHPVTLSPAVDPTKSQIIPRGAYISNSAAAPAVALDFNGGSQVLIRRTTTILTINVSFDVVEYH